MLCGVTMSLLLCMLCNGATKVVLVLCPIVSSTIMRQGRMKASCPKMSCRHALCVQIVVVLRIKRYLPVDKGLVFFCGATVVLAVLVFVPRTYDVDFWLQKNHGVV